MAERRPWGLWLLALCALATFVSAGTWQWGRALEKQALLQAREGIVESRRAQPLVDALGGPVDALDWVVGSGRFLPTPLVLLDNQQRDGRVGLGVFAAFDPVDGIPLLVDLGWVPWPEGRRLPVLEPLPDGRLELEGLMLAPPSAGLALGPALQGQDDGRLLAMRLELEAVADALGLPALAPRVLRLDPAIPLGHQRDLDVLPNTLPPEKHRGYAVQWFGLAAATVVITLVLSFRRRRS